MASYSVQIARAAAKELEDIPLKPRRRVAKRIAALARDPRPSGCEKLTGSDLFRIRQGDYRVVYRIDDDVVTVLILRVRHRKDIYRDI